MSISEIPPRGRAHSATPRVILKRELAAALALVLLVGGLGATLTIQGWRGRVPGSDVIPSIDGAHLLSRTELPERGVITSLASYAPPGLSWVLLPGVLLFSDARLFDVPGMVALHLGTLIGIFLLARTCFGARAAFLSVLLYGLSGIGLTFASSLGLAGPRGHPFFYVWMTYFVCLWVMRRDARYLAAACLTWVAGMYLFMEIAPALFVLPAIWLLYRPPVRLRQLALVAAVGLVIWFPYIRFESTRGFADLRSQLLVESIAPASYSGALCDATLKLRNWQTTPVDASSGGAPPAMAMPNIVIWSGGHVLAAAGGVIGNFWELVPGVGLVLLALTAAGLLIAGRQSGRLRASSSAAWPALLAIALLTWALVVNDQVVGYLAGSRLQLGPFGINAIHILQRLTAIAGIALLARRSIGRLLDTLAASLDPASLAPQVLAVALVVPWIILLLITEPGREDRFLGVWPLQAIVISFMAVTLSVSCGRAARMARVLIPMLIALLIVINPLTVGGVESWHRDGWSGSDSVVVQVADDLARRLHAEGKTQAAIGYRLFTDGPPTPPWQMADTRWKFGGEFDVALEDPHGISNLDRCAEGLSTQDEYRVVEVSPPNPESEAYFDVPVAGLRLLNRIGPYEVYKRE